MLLRLGSDDASPKGSVGYEANLLIVVVPGVLRIDAPERVLACVVGQQLRCDDLISVSGVQTAGDDQQEWRSLRSSRIDNLGGQQIVRLPRNGIIGRGRSQRRDDKGRHPRPSPALV